MKNKNTSISLFIFVQVRFGTRFSMLQNEKSELNIVQAFNLLTKHKQSEAESDSTASIGCNTMMEDDVNYREACL